MPLTPQRTRQFKRDYKLMGRRGKDLEKLRGIMRALVQEAPLDPGLRDHPLKGKFIGRRECHIESDWLLVYKREPGVIIFERTGTHTNLFE